MRIHVTATIGRAYVRHLRIHLRAAHRLLQSRLSELSVVLVNDRIMSDLHRRVMSIDSPTDVLTFPLDMDRRGRAISGEVVVCVPEARRRALELGTRPQDELLLYALHGMLHLSGFDDRTQREFDRMHRMEDRILTRLGVGPVFRPAVRSASARRHRRKGST